MSGRCHLLGMMGVCVELFGVCLTKEKGDIAFGDEKRCAEGRSGLDAGGVS